MARATRKPTSKRRAAALKFLSNISFETSAVQQQSTTEQTVEIKDEKRFDSHTHLATEDRIGIVHEFIPSKFIEMDCSKPQSFTPFRERSNTGTSDCGKKRDGKSRKTTEDISALLTFSSTESITSGSSKQRLDFDPRMRKLQEVKVARANNLRSYKNERIMLISPVTKTPFYVFSFIPYKKMKGKGETKKEGSSRRRNLSASRPLSSFIDSLDPFLLLGMEKYQDDQMISYQQLLLSTLPVSVDIKETTYQENDAEFPVDSANKNYHISRCMSVDLGMQTKLQNTSSPSLPFSEFRANDWEEYGFGGCNQQPYSPFLLDDPELMSGKHRTVLTFPSYRASIIDYVRPSDLKKELNEKFKEKFPHVQLTLSKLRSLKRDMKKISKTERCVDLLTVAQGYVYFEKLILRNVINKTNRKLCAAVCLLLSAKMNDTKGTALKQLLERLESVFRLSRKDLLNLEFAVVVALEFSLHVPTWEVLPHFQRLMYES